MDDQERVNDFFISQVHSWPLLADNREKLGSVRLKSCSFDGFSFRVQFNPGRIISSSVKVDPVSVKQRECFLCAGNRPPQQKALRFRDAYEILCNPFPIFREHFTIARTGHTPQVIGTEFGWLLELSRALPRLVVFYNGPDCGASAPDHMHFQAGSRGAMPLEGELAAVTERYGKPLVRSREFNATAIDDGLRRMILLESVRSERITDAFTPLHDFMRELREGAEPMLNILAYYRERWQVLIFPRGRHRPRQFFEKGENNILISPAAVDMGGLLITPLEKDFLRLSGEDIRDIFSQVSLPVLQFRELQELLSATYGHQP